MDNWFKNDVKKNTIFLFLKSGLVPTAYAKDKVFIEDFGCTGPDEKWISF
jgi:hypothetical protein